MVFLNLPPLLLPHQYGMCWTPKPSNLILWPPKGSHLFLPPTSWESSCFRKLSWSLGCAVPRSHPRSHWENEARLPSLKRSNAPPPSGTGLIWPHSWEPYYPQLGNGRPGKPPCLPEPGQAQTQVLLIQATQALLSPSHSTPL